MSDYYVLTNSFFQLLQSQCHSVIVVSPTIALITQQTEKLVKAGVQAVAIFGSVRQRTCIGNILRINFTLNDDDNNLYILPC